MTWLTWRQFRTQTLVTVAALAAIAVTLGITGAHLGGWCFSPRGGARSC